MQVVSVGVHDILPKSIDCHGNVPRQIGIQGTGLLSALRVLSCGEKIVICHVVNRIQMIPVFSGVTGPKFTIFLHDIEA